MAASALSQMGPTGCHAQCRTGREGWLPGTSAGYVYLSCIQVASAVLHWQKAASWAEGAAAHLRWLPTLAQRQLLLVQIHMGDLRIQLQADGGLQAQSLSGDVAVQLIPVAHQALGLEAVHRYLEGHAPLAAHLKSLHLCIIRIV